MFGSRTAIGVGCCALALGVAFGCGGTTVHGSPVDGAGSGAGGSGSGRAGAAGAPSVPRAGSPSSGGGATDGGPSDRDPVDSGCEMTELPPPRLDCDPFVAGACGPGAGCYPFVEHPEGSGCDQQVYGTICLPAGQGRQGALCGEDAADFCAEGFVCVVGQRAGKRCAALCRLGVANQCSGGLICGDLDVAGFGVCG